MNFTPASIRRIVLAVIGAACLLGFGYWRYSVASHTHPSHLAFLWDGSASAANDCDCLRGIATRSLTTTDLTSGSTLTLLRTGDSASTNEPVWVTEKEIPFSRKVVEGRAGTDVGREQLLAHLVAQCRALHPTDRSPLYQSIRRGVEHLQAKGCGPTRPCWLYVISDGEELVEPLLRQALRRPEYSTPIPLPPPIKNDGVQIVLLGVAQTAGVHTNAAGKAQPLTPNRSKQNPEHFRTIWRQVFTHPDQVTFEPFCPSLGGAAK